jgi:hypothetical protein
MWLVTVRGGVIEAALAANMKFLAVYGVVMMGFFVVGVGAMGGFRFYQANRFLRDGFLRWRRGVVRRAGVEIRDVMTTRT